VFGRPLPVFTAEQSVSLPVEIVDNYCVLNANIPGICCQSNTGTPNCHDSRILVPLASHLDGQASVSVSNDHSFFVDIELRR